MKQVKRKILLVLLTIVLATIVASTASAMEWHKTNTYTFNENTGEPSEIYFWDRDGNFVLLGFNWSEGLMKIIAQANEPVLGIQKAEEIHSTLYQTSPYNAFPVGEQLNTWQQTEAAETLVQFYWTNHEGPPWWQFNESVMDETAVMWNYAARFYITTNSSASTIIVEEWKNY